MAINPKPESRNPNPNVASALGPVQNCSQTVPVQVWVSGFLRISAFGLRILTDQERTEVKRAPEFCTCQAREICDFNRPLMLRG
jgi:hypothetical protein